MHHLKSTEHEMVKEKLTIEVRKRGNTFIKDKAEEKILPCTGIKVLYR